MMVCGTPCFCAAAKISMAGPKHAGQAFAVEDLQLPRRQAGSLIPWASFVDVDMHWDAGVVGCIDWSRGRADVHEGQPPCQEESPAAGDRATSHADQIYKHLRCSE